MLFKCSYSYMVCSKCSFPHISTGPPTHIHRYRCCTHKCIWPFVQFFLAVPFVSPFQIASAAFHLYLYERARTTAGHLLITLSNKPAPPTVSSPRGSAPLLMETNSGSARGRGVSKHPLSSSEKHWNSTETLQKQSLNAFAGRQ